MSEYFAYQWYSPTRGCEVVRISMADERGGEFFMTIPHSEGRAFRERRADAVELIAEAIRLGLYPGEVRAI